MNGFMKSIMVDSSLAMFSKLFMRKQKIQFAIFYYVKICRTLVIRVNFGIDSIIVIFFSKIQLFPQIREVKNIFLLASYYKTQLP